MSDFSSVRLVLDQGIPREAAVILREAGVECVHVGELGLSTAEDITILELARHRDAAVVTLDADFHMILAVTSAPRPSAIRLRLQGLGGVETAQLTLAVIARFSDELKRGCLITVKPKKTTCHLLPVVEQQ